MDTYDNMETDRNIFKFWLHRIPFVGDSTIYKLLEEYTEAGDVFEAFMKSDEKVLRIIGEKRMNRILEKKDIRFFPSDGTKERITHVTELIAKDYRLMTESGISFVTVEDEDYPSRLLDINPAPYALYVKGRLPENDVPSVAIIGARNCSEYGTYIANAFGEALAKEGVNIISGMARGVDGISQRGALNVDGNTFAVLGSGVDVCYPEGNYKLYRDIQKKGGVISTFPPGTEPLKQQFPERNKIVAALADILLVVEARVKSGTSITVDLALKMGKDVYAVPGRLTDRLSDGCNLLIRDGAGIALSPEDILRELAVFWNRLNPEDEDFNQNTINHLNPGRPREDIGLLKYLDATPHTADEIHQKRLTDEEGISLSQTLSELVLLCVDGKAVQVGSGYFYRPY